MKNYTPKKENIKKLVIYLKKVSNGNKKNK
jgi:hypothetical protein